MPISEFRIIRSLRRKRISFRFAPDGILEILAPQNVSESYLRQAVINSLPKLEKLKKRTPVRTYPDFSNGSKFMLLGIPYPLRITARLRTFDQAFLIPADNAEKMKHSLATLYRELAEKIIRERVKKWENICGVYPKKIRISSASSRWGSCTSDKTVSFSWKLIQCPPETVDYVIVHELSHLKELNHSPNFWRLVKEAMPDFKTRQELLKQFAKTLPVW